jgi:hypothetical protein
MAIVLRHWSRRFAREGAGSGPSQGNSDPRGLVSSRRNSERPKCGDTFLD